MMRSARGKLALETRISRHLAFNGRESMPFPLGDADTVLVVLLAGELGFDLGDRLGS
jgi:hypothetical protein